MGKKKSFFLCLAKGVQNPCLTLYFVNPFTQTVKTHLIALLLSSTPETLTVAPVSMMPLFGRTQYRFGAVVFTLKHTRFSVGFVSLSSDVTTSVNGPEVINNIPFK